MVVYTSQLASGEAGRAVVQSLARVFKTLPVHLTQVPVKLYSAQSAISDLATQAVLSNFYLSAGHSIHYTIVVDLAYLTQSVTVVGLVSHLVPSKYFPSAHN